MPRTPVWESEVGTCRVEEYRTNARGTHFEFRVANGHPLVIFPHELAKLQALLLHVETHRVVPAEALGERRRA